MEIQIVPLIIVVAYLVGMLFIGFLVGKLSIKDSSDYMVAGRRMGLFMVAFSLSANNIGGGSTTGLAAKAFGSWGMSACWYVLAASVAMIPLAYFAPKIRQTMAITIPEVMERRYGKGIGTFSAVLNILALFCLTSSQIAASGSVVSSLTGIPMNGVVIVVNLKGKSRKIPQKLVNGASYRVWKEGGVDILFSGKVVNGGSVEKNGRCVHGNRGNQRGKSRKSTPGGHGKGASLIHKIRQCLTVAL